MENKSNEYVKIEQLLADLPDHDLPPGLHKKIMENLHMGRRKKSALRWVKSISATAAAAFVFIFWINFWNQNPIPPYENVEPAMFSIEETSLPIPPIRRDILPETHARNIFGVEDLARVIAEMENLPGVTNIEQADEGVYVTIEITAENISIVQRTISYRVVFQPLEPDTEVVFLFIEIQ